MVTNIDDIYGDYIVTNGLSSPFISSPLDSIKVTIFAGEVTVFPG
jgi:hypothetical protein